MIFFVIARAESSWRSTVFQKANRTYPYASIACSGLPRRSLRFLLAMTWCVVLERYTDSLHILSSRGRSPWRSTVFQKANRTCPYASIACSGLPRQTVVFLAITNCMLWPNRILHFFMLLSSRGLKARGDPLCHENRAAQSRCAHCMQWIAASLAPLSPRNDRCVM